MIGILERSQLAALLELDPRAIVEGYRAWPAGRVEGVPTAAVGKLQSGDDRVDRYGRGDPGRARRKPTTHSAATIPITKEPARARRCRACNLCRRRLVVPATCRGSSRHRDPPRGGCKGDAKERSRLVLPVIEVVAQAFGDRSDSALRGGQ